MIGVKMMQQLFDITKTLVTYFTLQVIINFHAQTFCVC